MQFTVRGITEEIDRAARQSAERDGVSLNQALLQALRSGLGVAEDTPKKRDLSGIFDGEPLEPEVIQALEEQRQIDPEMWK